MNDDRGQFRSYGSYDEAKEARSMVRDKERALGLRVTPHDIFSVGEEITVKSTRLRVTSIGKKFIHFAVLPTLAGEQEGGAL